jgi:hypothetical protein
LQRQHIDQRQRIDAVSTMTTYHKVAGPYLSVPSALSPSGYWWLRCSLMLILFTSLIHCIPQLLYYSTLLRCLDVTLLLHCIVASTLLRRIVASTLLSCSPCYSDLTPLVYIVILILPTLFQRCSDI